MVNIFTTGGKKYLHKEFKQSGNDEKSGVYKMRRKKPQEKKKEKQKENIPKNKRRMKEFYQDI